MMLRVQKCSKVHCTLKSSPYKTCLSLPCKHQKNPISIFQLEIGVCIAQEVQDYYSIKNRSVKWQKLLYKAYYVLSHIEREIEK